MNFLFIKFLFKQNNTLFCSYYFTHYSKCNPVGHAQATPGISVTRDTPCSSSNFTYNIIL